MKILLDARWIFPEISGIGRYTQELLRALAEQDSPHTLLALFDRPEIRDRALAGLSAAAAARVRPIVWPRGVFSLRSQWELPRRLRAWGVDIYHAPNYWIPFAAFPRNCAGAPRAVVTLHDLIPLVHPEYTPRAWKTRLHPLFRAALRESARRAATILTPSAHSEALIRAHLLPPGAPADRVVVTPEGVDARYAPDPAPRRADPPEILYVGRRDPYKNLAGLVRAFALLRAGPQPRATLRVIGSRDARYPEPEHLARALGVADAVRWEGYVAPEEIAPAYRRASVFAMPSRDEGFGLPVLEAMACGTPVVCSRAASLPDVAGDAALYADPDHPEEWAARLDEVLRDPARAAELRARGLEQARKFTWAATAAATRRVYELRGGTSAVARKV